MGPICLLTWREATSDDQAGRGDIRDNVNSWQTPCCRRREAEVRQVLRLPGPTGLEQLSCDRSRNLPARWRDCEVALEREEATDGGGRP